jgi:hypothetical protein
MANHTYNVIVINEAATSQDVINDAHKKIEEFFTDYPEAQFLNAEIESDCIGYDWSEKLTMNFNVKFEGCDDLTTVKITWYQDSCSCDRFYGFISIPSYEPHCLPQLNKWYKLDDGKTELDVAIETLNVLEVKKILDEKHTAELNKKISTINSLSYQITGLKYKLETLKKEYNVAMKWCALFGTMVALYVPVLSFYMLKSR